MFRARSKFFFFALMISSFICGPAASISAMHLGQAKTGPASAVQPDQTLPIIQVRGRGSRDAGVAAGIIGGLIAGAIIASQRPQYSYDYGYYNYPPYGYYGPYPTRDGAVAYCLRRFRSYDPYSMTYLGYDGFRHPCP